MAAYLKVTRTMKIALLNMMPDAALKATDRQYQRLLRGHKDTTLHVFTFQEIVRNIEAQSYIEQNYQSESEVLALKPKAIIITGANVSNPNLETQSFWRPLQKTMAWAEQKNCPVLCSCLASHAVMQFRFGLKRSPLPDKIWGVFQHRVIDKMNALVAGLPEAVLVPQSRFNEISAHQFQAAGLDVLIADHTVGVHLVASKDNRLVFMQGHPEYDDVSLLKEYKREVRLFFEGARPEYPLLPQGFLKAEGGMLLEKYKQALAVALNGENTERTLLEFPEATVRPFLENNWQKSARTVFDNWVRAVKG